jgi:hypothetical protein
METTCLLERHSDGLGDVHARNSDAGTILPVNISFYLGEEKKTSQSCNDIGIYPDWILVLVFL